jgi:hypothetical protein
MASRYGYGGSPHQNANSLVGAGQAAHAQDKKVKESEIQNQILDYLALKRIFHYRTTSGAFKRDDGRFYRLGATGSPDIICVIAGQYVGSRCVGRRYEDSLNFGSPSTSLTISDGTFDL